MRRVFSTSVFLRFRPKGLVDKRVLLCHHKREGMWLPIGGEVQFNESPFTSLLREVKEETGLELTNRDFASRPMPGMPPGFIGYEEHPAGVKEGEETVHMNFVFVAEAPTDEVTICDEHNELLWFTYEECKFRKDEMPPNVWHCIDNFVFHSRDGKSS